MNSLQSAQHVINLIVKQSKEKINQNKLVKTMIVPYSNTLAQTNRNDAILHAGTHFDRSSNNFFKKQIDSQHKPKNSIKDTYSFFSLKKTKQDKKQNIQLSIPKKNTPNKHLKNFFKSTNFQSNNSQKQRSINKDIQTPLKSTLRIESLKDTLLFRLQEQKQIVPRFIQKEQRLINYLRDIKNSEFQQKQTGRKRDQQNSQINTARQNKISEQLESHLAKPNNNYTYDVDGAILLINSDSNKKAIGKSYPPGIRYEIQNEQDYEDFSQRRKNSNRNRNRAYSNLEFKRIQKPYVNILGAKGEIFKSSVLKTINLSRISMGNEHLDEAHFMKRNDLFNNNHSRQTTSIPFLKMENGTSFKQTATNQCISNKDPQKQAQNGNIKQPLNQTNDNKTKSNDFRAKRQFKKYNLRRESFDKLNIQLEIDSAKKDYSNIRRSSQKLIGDSRYNSFYIPRPHTSQVGRIKRQNQALFDSMLDEN